MRCSLKRFEQNEAEEETEEEMSAKTNAKVFYRLGLTGSIGTGKSTISKMLKEELAVPVFDADEEVHLMYEDRASVACRSIAMSASFNAGKVLKEDGTVDRAKLRDCVVTDKEKMRELESIVHPLVDRAREEFVRVNSQESSFAILVFDVPLLFEKNLEGTVDGVLVVSCAEETQRERVLKRGNGMTDEKFEKIKQMQISDDEKRRRADWVVTTDCAIEESLSKVKEIVREIKEKYLSTTTATTTT